MLIRTLNVWLLFKLCLISKHFDRFSRLIGGDTMNKTEKKKRENVTTI